MDDGLVFTAKGKHYLHGSTGFNSLDGGNAALSLVNHVVFYFWRGGLDFLRPQHELHKRGVVTVKLE